MKYYLNPLTWLYWVRQFLFAWLMSIRWQGAAYAIPAVLVLVLMITGTALAWSGSNTWRHRLVERKAQEAFQQEDFDVVELLLRRRIRQSPQDENLQLRLAQSLDEMGKHEESVEMFKHLALQTRNGRAAMWLLRNHLNPEEIREWTPERMTLYRQLTEVLVAEMPESLSANAMRADYFVRSGQPLDAIPYLDKLIVSQPLRGLQVASLLKAHGDSARGNEYAARVLRWLDQELADDPKNVELRLVHAQTLVFLRRYEETVRSLRQGMELTRDERFRPVMAEALVLYAESLGNQAQSEDTTALIRRLKCLQLALQYAPANPAVVRAVSDTVLATVGEDNAQVRALRESLIAGSSPALAHFIRGTAAMLEGNTDTAAIELELAAKEMPHAAAILNNLAVAKAQAAKDSGDSKTLDEALTLVDKAISMAQETGGSEAQLMYFHETRGQILLEQQQYIEAIYSLEKALPVPQLKEQVHRSLATAYRALDQSQIADEHLASAEQIVQQQKDAEARAAAEAAGPIIIKPEEQK